MISVLELGFLGRCSFIKKKNPSRLYLVEVSTALSLSRRKMGAFRVSSLIPCWFQWHYLLLIQVSDSKKESDLSFVWFHLQFHQYQVVGRALPTEKDVQPKIYRMKLWATNEVRAKSKFWLVIIFFLSLFSIFVAAENDMSLIFN